MAPRILRDLCMKQDMETVMKETFWKWKVSPNGLEFKLLFKRNDSLYLNVRSIAFRDDFL